MVLERPDGPVRLGFDAHHIHFRGVYDGNPDGNEPEVTTFMETMLRGDRVLFDIGANFGYLTLYAATIEGYSGAIHSFEPIDNTFKDLNDLVTQAGYEGRVTCHQIALSDHDGTAKMAFDPVNTGLSRLDGDTSGGKEVALAKLDSLDLPAPWLMKVDVEDHELKTFQGAEALLKKEKPFLIFENWISKTEPQTTLGPLRYLEGLGYVLYNPLWRISDQAGSYIWPTPSPPWPYETRALALVRFPAEGRFPFADQINVVGCHRDRIVELQEEFSSCD